jgi:hypothetical protein
MEKGGLIWYVIKEWMQILSRAILFGTGLLALIYAGIWLEAVRPGIVGIIAVSLLVIAIFAIITGHMVDEYEKNKK